MHCGRTALAQSTLQGQHHYSSPNTSQISYIHSMEEDLYGIRVCCICHRQDEARWCFWRDKNAVYCSIECQRDGWQVHKQVCSWYEAKIKSRIQRHRTALAQSNSQWKHHYSFQNTNQISRHYLRSRPAMCAVLARVNNVHLSPQLHMPPQLHHPNSMKDDLCGIRKCCICHRWDEARWCFCRARRRFIAV